MLADRFESLLHEAARTLATAEDMSTAFSRDAGIRPGTVLNALTALSESMRCSERILYHLYWLVDRAARDTTGPQELSEALQTLAVTLRGATREARATTRALQGHTQSATVVRDIARGLKKCPECGELAVRATPTDLTAQQRVSGLRPQYAHADRTQLCPVVGDGGYVPAQPVSAIATFTL